MSGNAISLLKLCCSEKVLPWILSKSLKVLRSQVICVFLYERSQEEEADFQLRFSPVKSTVLRRPEAEKGGGKEHHNLVQQFVPWDSTRFHPSPLVMPPKVKLELNTMEMARSVHSWDTGVVCHCDTSYIHIRKGEFLLGEFTICIKQVQLNGFSLVFKFDNYHWNFKSRYFTGFGCLTVTCTEFVLIRLLMVIEWWDWENLVTLRPG